MARPRTPDVLCPHCQSDQVACVIYGNVECDAEWLEMIFSGLVTGGGCMIYSPMMRLFCNACKKLFGTDEESRQIANRLYRRARSTARRRLKRRRAEEEPSRETDDHLGASTPTKPGTRP